MKLIDLKTNNLANTFNQFQKDLGGRLDEKVRWSPRCKTESVCFKSR